MIKPMPEQTKAASSPAPTTLRQERWMLIGVLVVGLLHGLLYVFIMPPWQHYEEPSHFEYAWLIASRLSLPTYPAYDQEKRREIAASMIKHGFFHDLGFLPNLEAKEEPIWIGVNVTGALPLYHILIALPLRFFLQADVVSQLYIGRLVSLALYLLMIGLTYQVVAEFVPPGHLLRWSVPGAVAMLPGFADLMTAVNNDVGASFVFSLFLWATVRLVLRGFSILRLLGVFGAAFLCAGTKNTVLVAIPLVPVAIVLSLTQTRRRLFTGFLLLLGGSVLGIVAMLDWGDAALWYRETMQESTTRVHLAKAPVGEYAIGLEVTAESPRPQVRQVLLAEHVAALRGQTVTLGAWMWATRPTQARSPILFDGRQTISRRVEISTVPSFHAVQATIPQDTRRIQVILRPDLDRNTPESVMVYYDGVVLIEGEWPLDSAPQFNDSQGWWGTWNGHQITNRVRNASSERGWLWVRPWVERLAKRYSWSAHLSPSIFLDSLMDWRNTEWIYRVTVDNLFETFWARFGWAHVRLPSLGYEILRIVTVLGIMGAMLALWKAWKRQSIPTRFALTWLGLIMLVIWGILLGRGLFTWLDNIYIPTARYGYPAIIPTMLLLSAGWRELLSRFCGLAGMVQFAAFLLLDIISILVIVNFYQGR